ncbi:nucleic-acid-binding protein from transposon X-element [Trichonephila inaurata madagascariensis]|uniref:Nucleic-acid-binding protein from transposon X-element n=1 Tax=Trichonephila inaurata madagascariensis TaxID=2747483 RepID=A0A8X7BZE5_9ARAC|nr:nucleic-acid-binding protein from transposon X-element [Trichonephila inaurata madagascariensis]
MPSNIPPHTYGRINSFEIFAYQAQNEVPFDTKMWQKLGSVNAMELPMASLFITKQWFKSCPADQCIPFLPSAALGFQPDLCFLFQLFGLPFGYVRFQDRCSLINRSSSKDGDGFTVVGRKGRRIAPIVIDSQRNATELLDQLGKFCDTPLEGRYENGKLRVFPVSAEEHRLIQKYISDNKLRSHTFEMAHNKQLKVGIRGLPTDFDQELLSELHAFGFKPNHISLLRNRKTNTNMPLFLVTLPKCPENQDIFNIKTIGFFRVVVEPLNKSTMPPQCYRCQEFFHHSRFCSRAPKCLKCSGGHLTSECTVSQDPDQVCKLQRAAPCKLLRMPQKSHQHEIKQK